MYAQSMQVLLWFSVNFYFESFSMISILVFDALFRQFFNFISFFGMFFRLICCQLMYTFCAVLVVLCFCLVFNSVKCFSVVVFFSRVCVVALNNFQFSYVQFIWVFSLFVNLFNMSLSQFSFVVIILWCQLCLYTMPLVYVLWPKSIQSIVFISFLFFGN
jgi:hypothetical protein